MMVLLAVAAVVALVGARAAADRLGRARHWRVGRWGRVLCIWRRVGESCLGCKTDYRYVLGHPIRYSGDTIDTARAMVPLCQRCWGESSEHERLLAAGMILNDWRRTGHYGDGDSFAKDEWDSHRLEVFVAIKGGM